MNLEKCDFCGNDPIGICVKCQKPFCMVHGTRTGQGTPVCFPCLQIERSKDKWNIIYLVMIMGILIGLGVPAIATGTFIVLYIAIGIDIGILYLLIRNLMR